MEKNCLNVIGKNHLNTENVKGSLSALGWPEHRNITTAIFIPNSLS